MLEDYGSAGGGGVTDLQGAYDGGNVVNGQDVILETFVGPNLHRIGLGNGALDGNTEWAVTGIGKDALKNNTGQNSTAIGDTSGVDNSGIGLVSIGGTSAFQNQGDDVIALGRSSGRKNTADNSNFFGFNAGYNSGGDTGNTTSHGVTVFSPESIPSYANKGAAQTALTVANGCVAGQIYLFRNEANDNIGFIIPSA